MESEKIQATIFVFYVFRTSWLHGMNLFFVQYRAARQSKIDLNERWPCTPCKASEEDRFGAAAASTNSQNLTERGINR